MIKEKCAVMGSTTPHVAENRIDQNIGLITGGKQRTASRYLSYSVKDFNVRGRSVQRLAANQHTYSHHHCTSTTICNFYGKSTRLQKENKLFLQEICLVLSSSFYYLWHSLNTISTTHCQLCNCNQTFIQMFYVGVYPAVSIWFEIWGVTDPGQKISIF